MPQAAIDDYYRRRARDYEAIYAKPERQSDLAQLRAWLKGEARGRNLLEVACGTGYWTSVAAETAHAILATDGNAEPLAIARAKGLGSHVVFAQADAYDLPRSDGKFDGGMAHFWWSHIPSARQREFLGHLSARLRPGAGLLMIDNTFVAGSSTPISRTDAAGNTYQIRSLPTGESFEVLKNFPSPREIKAVLGAFASCISLLELKCFWAVSAQLAPAKGAAGAR
jgi:demethylmenaquinone methyltransferase/2-methoxy-6-polyprenyl-1,4-benzoquinol methylase